MSQDYVLVLAITGCILLVLAGYVWDRALRLRLKALVEEARARGDDREAAASKTGDGDADEIISLARRIERMAQALQKIEASYRGIVEDLTDLICRYRPDGHLTFVNGAYARFFGKVRGDLTGQNFPPYERGLPPRRADGALPERAAFDQEMVNAAGQRRWIAWTNRAIADLDGEILEYQAVGHDITATREAENALRRAKETAEIADRTKSEFLAIISHELRTPINGVIGFSRLLQETALTREQKEYVELIRSSGGHLEALVNDILDLSQIVAGELTLVRSPFALHKCVEGIVALFAPQARQAGLGLELQIAPDVPAVVNGDERRFHQILTNLAGNAVKFTEQGGVHLRVSCRKGEVVPGTTWRPLTLQVTVRDTGIGIAPDRLPSLFQPFSQIDTSLRRKRGGTGLGLAITKRLCEMMGGGITVESNPGAGSNFNFSAQLEYEESDPAPVMVSVPVPSPVPAR